MNVDVEYTLAGIVNNTPIRVDGRGAADLDSGEYDMTLTLGHVPMQWDPAFVILMCCDFMIGVGCKERANAQNMISLSNNGTSEIEIANRESKILDDKGRIIGRAMASSFGIMRGQVLTSISQIFETDIRLGVNEEVTEIRTPYYATMLPTAGNLVLITSEWSFKTNNNHTYDGYTLYPYRITSGLPLDNPQIITIDKVQFKRSKKTTGETIFSFTTNSYVDILAKGNIHKSPGQ